MAPLRDKHGKIAQRAEDYATKLMGWDSLGREIWHHSYYDPDTKRHISYDTIVLRGEHEYLTGTGHERDDRGGYTAVRWDREEKSWKDHVVRNA